MEIVKKKVNTFGEFAFCEKCKKELVFTGKSLMSNPPKYEHKCPVCGRIENLNYTYPRIAYEFVE